MVTLKDVANQLGVSVSTVSRALSGSSEVSAETREKVRKAAEEVGYFHPNEGVKVARSKSAGIIVPEIASEFYSEVAQTLKVEMRKNGYFPVIAFSSFRDEEILTTIRWMLSAKVDCLMLVIDDGEKIYEGLAEFLNEMMIPVILLTNRNYQIPNIDCVYFDDYSAMLTGTRYLIERGYERIGFIGETRAESRLESFRKSFLFLGRKADESLICCGAESGELGGYQRMNELLARKKKPDAVVCNCDHMAIGAIYAAEEKSLRIPEDLALISFDNVVVSRYIAGGITTVAEPYEDMVSIAVNILLKKVQDSRRATQQVAVQPRIIIRHTA